MSFLGAKQEAFGAAPKVQAEQGTKNQPVVRMQEFKRNGEMTLILTHLKGSFDTFEEHETLKLSALRFWISTSSSNREALGSTH